MLAVELALPACRDKVVSVDPNARAVLLRHALNDHRVHQLKGSAKAFAAVSLGIMDMNRWASALDRGLVNRDPEATHSSTPDMRNMTPSHSAPIPATTAPAVADTLVSTAPKAIRVLVIGEGIVCVLQLANAGDVSRVERHLVSVAAEALLGADHELLTLGRRQVHVVDELHERTRDCSWFERALDADFDGHSPTGLM